MLKRLLCFVLIFAFLACNESQNKQENNVSKVENNTQEQKPLRVFAAHAILTVLLEVLYPQGIIGVTYKPNPEELEFMPENAANLPVLGMQGNMSFERIVSLKPDLVIFMKETDDTMLEPYERLGIKTLKINGLLEDLEQSLSILGEALGVQERADRLLAFHKRTQKLLNELRAKVTKKPRIYFAYGYGKRTECVSEGQTNDIASLMGAENVIKCPENKPSPRGGFLTNFEIVMAQNPDVIFVREIGFYKELMNNPSEEWARLEAVKNKRIIYAPSSPSNWITLPPSVLCIIGYSWAFAKLHPELLSENEAKKIAQEFFAEFLRPLSDEAYKRLEAKD